MRPVVFSSRGAFALLVLVAGASSCEAPAFVRGSGAEGGPSEAGADGERESRGAGEMGASGGLSATSASAIPPETDTSYGGRPEPEVLPPGRRYGNGRSRDADSLGVLLARTLGGNRAGEITRYWLYLPPNLSAQSRWPLLLYLHGRSLRGSDLDQVRKYGLPWRMDQGDHLPLVVVAPQLPAGQRWVDMDRLLTLVDTVAATAPIDPARIYVTGYSMGAGGAWRAAIAAPDRFAAAVPIAATTPAPTEANVAALARIPLWIALSEPHYGIHGTSAPETIGYVTSSGCVRLTNWDAARLAGLIESDTEVEFRDIRRETPASDG